MSTQITINRDGQQYGPYSLQELTTHLQSGAIVPTDWAWAEGMDEWKPLREIVDIPTRQKTQPRASVAPARPGARLGAREGVIESASPSGHRGTPRDATVKGFVSYYLGVLNKYAVFEGRARRKEYWIFGLGTVLIAFALAIVEGILGIAPESDSSVLAGLFWIGVMFPGIAVAVRRLHDTGRSGWWIFITFVPVIGAIILFLWLVQDSSPGANEYGENPKEQPLGAVATSPSTGGALNPGLAAGLGVAGGAIAATIANRMLSADRGVAGASSEYVGYDMDGDGRIDTVAADLNNDGRIDVVGSDLDGDGKLDAVAVDLDHDGITDGVAWDTDADGICEHVAVDVDGDGSFDAVAADFDGDGEVDALAMDLEFDGAEELADGAVEGGGGILDQLSDLFG